MSIKPIKKINVTEQVFEQLKNMLVKEEWKQGEKIPSENELAENFGVSRITVRQALQKLSVIGLIETKLGEGSFVKEVEPGDNMNALIPAVLLSHDRILQVIEFREIIEVESVKLAADRADKKDILALKQIWEKMKESKGSPKVFGAADLEFHMKLGQLTKNDLIEKTQGILHSALQETMDEVVERTGYDSGIHYHEEIIKAIEQQDGSLAATIMKEHLEYNKKIYKDADSFMRGI